MVVAVVFISVVLLPEILLVVKVVVVQEDTLPLLQEQEMEQLALVAVAVEVKRVLAEMVVLAY